MATSRIEWTEQTWNPVTGCTQVSAGCQHYYAERIALRLQAMAAPGYGRGFALTLHEAQRPRGPAAAARRLGAGSTRSVPAAGVAFLFNQWGAWGTDGVRRDKQANGRWLAGRRWERGRRSRGRCFERLA